MGSYLNPGNKGFRESLNSEIYVDKTGLIDKTNAVLNTRQKFLCVSRPRRFGKSMAADMLAAYYERGEDSTTLFDSLKISKVASYHIHLNQYDVIKVNMQEFLSMTNNMDDMLHMLQKYLIFDLVEHFADVRFRDENNLIQVMKDIYSRTNRSFVILIDEWVVQMKRNSRWYVYYQWACSSFIVCIFYDSSLSFPIKKSAIVSGPTWLPVQKS